MNEKQKPFVYGGIVCGVLLAVLIGFFPEAINVNPVLKAAAIVLIIPTSIVSLWFLTEILMGLSDR